MSRTLPLFFFGARRTRCSRGSWRKSPEGGGYVPKMVKTSLASFCLIPRSSRGAERVLETIASRGCAVDEVKEEVSAYRQYPAESLTQDPLVTSMMHPRLMALCGEHHFEGGATRRSKCATTAWKQLAVVQSVDLVCSGNLTDRSHSLLHTHEKDR